MVSFTMKTTAIPGKNITALPFQITALVSKPGTMKGSLIFFNDFIAGMTTAERESGCPFVRKLLRTIKVLLQRMVNRAKEPHLIFICQRNF